MRMWNVSIGTNATPNDEAEHSTSQSNLNKKENSVSRDESWDMSYRELETLKSEHGTSEFRMDRCWVIGALDKTFRREV